MRRAFAIALTLLVAGCHGGGGGGPAGPPQRFTRQADFLEAIARYTDQQTVGFDGLAGGSLLPNNGGTGGITFSYAIATLSMAATGTLPTTSPANSLGLNAPDGQLFTGGDGFVMTFDRTVHAVGLFVIGEDLQPGDVTLSSGSGRSVRMGGQDPDVAVSGAQVFFLGLTDAAGFTTATLSTGAEGYVFNVDDIITAVTPP